MEKVKGFIARMDNEGLVTCEKKEYVEVSIPDALVELTTRKEIPGKCYLFFHEDVPGMGHRSERTLNSTREDFEREPEIFGICLYKNWHGGPTWE